MKKAIEIFREDFEELFSTIVALDLYTRLSVYSKKISDKKNKMNESNANFFKVVDQFENKNYVFNYLFIQAITILETYLNLRLREELENDSSISTKIVKEYNIKRKLTSQDIINGPDEMALEIIESIIYHNFTKVNVLYKIVFNCDILKFIPKELWLDVKIRHKLVHQSGVIQETKISMGSVDFHLTLQNVLNWVENIEYFIKNGKQRIKFPSVAGKFEKTYAGIRDNEIYKETNLEIKKKIANLL